MLNQNKTLHDMNIKQILASLGCTLLLLGCGDDKAKVDGGYFGEIPSILVNQAIDKDKIRQEATTKAETADDLVRLHSQSERMEQEYKAQLERAVAEFEAANIRYEIENPDYAMENPPTMSLTQSSSNTCRATIRFSLKTKTAISNSALGSYVKSYNHTVYCKFVDAEGQTICKREWTAIGKMEGQQLGEMLQAGAIIPVEMSISIGADKEELNGETVFVVPEAKIDRMVVTTKTDFDEI